MSSKYLHLAVAIGAVAAGGVTGLVAKPAVARVSDCELERRCSAVAIPMECRLEPWTVCVWNILRTECSTSVECP
jgi:hypothetical protein